MSSIVILPASIRINACLREILASGSSASRSTSGNDPVSGSHLPTRLLPSSSGNSWPLRPPRTTDSFALNGAPAAAAVGADGALSGAASGLISAVDASDLGASAVGVSPSGFASAAAAGISAGTLLTEVGAIPAESPPALTSPAGLDSAAGAGAAAPTVSFAPHPSQ